jgi:hypothetical protein
MYSKYKIQKLITKHEESFKKVLGIKNVVKWHVYDGTTKKYKELIANKVGVPDCPLQGITYIAASGAAEIIIFFDQHNNERDVIGTIFHELLHVRIYKLTGLITLKSERGGDVEETLVRDIEEMFLQLFYDGKLK